MGKAARDVGSKIRACSCYLPVKDVCGASPAGHFTVWFHAEDCRNFQCSHNCLSEDSGRKKYAACLTDFKDLILLLSILLSSRFCSNFSGQPEEVSAKHIHPVCKGSSEKVLWPVRVWVVSAALLLLLLFPSLLPRTAAGRNNLGLYSWLHTNVHWGFISREYKSAASAVAPLSTYIFPSMFSFQEAPPFHNRMGCPIPQENHNRMGCPIPQENAFVCDSSSVHIVMTLDGAYLRGSMAAVFSILQHAACPENVVFHFLVSEYDSWFRSLVRSIFPSLKFKIYHFEATLVRDRISTSVRQALEQPLNYARNYMADLLEPCVRRVIYLDSDLVVVDDIFKLWMTKLGSRTVAAPEYCHANFSKYFSSSFWGDPILAKTFQGRKPCYFNTGVMVIDLDQWRRQNCTKKIEHWMQVQKEFRIYELGSLPPFLLVFAGYVEPVEHRWNQHGLGGDNVKGSCRALHPGPVSLLHWSGEGKPWSRLDSRHPCPLDSLWAPFDLFVNSSY